MLGNYLTDPNLLGYRYLQPVTLQVFDRPLPNQVTGQVKLAFVQNSRTIVGLSKEELNQHMLIFGRSGSGKTNITRIIQSELMRNQIPFLAFDLAKFNTRYQISGDFPLILQWKKEFFLNPLKPPPGAGIVEWMLIFCEVSSETWGLMQASKSVLIDTVKNLYSQFRVEATNTFPTMRDIFSQLEQKRKKTFGVERDYIDRLRNRINAICLTLGDQLEVEQGLPIDQLLKYPVCLEFVGINNTEIQTWLVNLIIAWISAYRKTQSHFDGLQHVIFYDEASQTFSKHKTGNTETFLIHQTRLLRESGEAIVLADQSIATLNDVLKSNVYTYIGLSQSGPIDPREAIAVLGLDREQAQILNKLEPGQAVVKLAGRYPYPLQVTFPFIEPRYISDEELEQINNENPIIAYLKSQVKLGASDATEIASSKVKEMELSDNEKRFLVAVYNHQFKTTLTEIYEIGGFSAGTGSRLAKACEKKALIKIIKTTLKTGSPRYPVLMPEAYEMMRLPKRDFYGKGASLEHILYQQLIADHVKQYKPKIELNRKGKFVDVAIETNGSLLCIEVEMTPAHVKENVEKDLMAGAHQVIVACVDSQVKTKADEILAGLSDEIRNKTEVFLISELLNKAPPEIVSKTVSTVLEQNL